MSLSDRCFESKLAPCDLQLLHAIGGSGEENAPAVFDESEAESGGKMRLSAAGRAEEKEIGALFEPGIGGGERLDLRLGDHRHGAEVEGVESFSGRLPLP